MQLPGDIAYNLMQQSATPFHKHSLKHFKVRFIAEHKKQTQNLEEKKCLFSDLVCFFRTNQQIFVTYTRRMGVYNKWILVMTIPRSADAGLKICVPVPMPVPVSWCRCRCRFDFKTGAGACLNGAGAGAGAGTGACLILKLVPVPVPVPVPV